MSEGLKPGVASLPDGGGPSFDQLDRLVRVTTIHGWVYLGTLFTVCAAVATFAVVYRVPTKVQGEGILLIDRDTLAQVRARGTGRLISLSVKLGETVAPGQTIGEIAQDELRDAIHEAEAKLRDAEGENRELTLFEDKERDTQNAAIDQVKRSIVLARSTSRDKMKIADRVVTSADRLRAQSYLGDLELLDSREKLYDIRDDLNKGESRLAELELERVKGESVRGRAQLERSLKIRQMKTKLQLDHEKLGRTSRRS